MSEKWAYSINEENYDGPFDSKEIAIQECIGENDLESGDELWVSPVRFYSHDEVSDFDENDTELFLDNAQDNLDCNDWGFWEDALLQYKKVDLKRLTDGFNKVWREWLNSIKPPIVFMAVKPEKIIVGYDC